LVNSSVGHLIDHPAPAPYFDMILNRITPQLFRWDRLPTSSRFSILQFLAELDDTLLLFTKRFWRELNYGSFTWGVLPFVNDVKAILETISSLSTDLSQVSYEEVISSSLHEPWVSGSGGYSVTVEQRLQGSLDLSASSGAAIWLDRLGFHPDIGTAWDLVPLSFVVDWILPVGDFLSQFYDRGWIKSAPFVGWRSVSFMGTVHNLYGGTEYLYATREGPYSYKGYARDFVRESCDLQTPASIDFSIPSLKELFNILYIFVLSKRRQR
jgi:hypothetical protein